MNTEIRSLLDVMVHAFNVGTPEAGRQFKAKPGLHRVSGPSPPRRETDPNKQKIKCSCTTFFKKDLIIQFMCMSTLLLSSESTRRRHQIPLQIDCELPCGCWELNSRLLEAQSVLLTTDVSLQPHTITSLRCAFQLIHQWTAL